MTFNYQQSPLLATLRGATAQPDGATREQLCQLLTTALDNYYVHLPQKRAAFAIDPVQDLRLLSASDGRDFIRRLLGTINSLHDRHTTLKLAQPWTSMVAYVPFVLERYAEQGRFQCALTKPMFGFDEIPIGSVITHWNGTPIELYLQAQAAYSQGANWDARMRLATANLTIRPLAYMLKPQEDWVTLNYIAPDGRAHAHSTPWRFFVQDLSFATAGTHAMGSVNRPEALVGLDEMSATTNKFRRDAIAIGAQDAQQITSEMDGQLRYAALADRAHGTDAQCGYIRLTTFEVPDATAFVQHMAGILQRLPQERLIIDIRSNPGGLIPAGQKLIRLLTTNPLTPSPVAFRNTPSTRRFGRVPQFCAWQDSLNIQFSTGQVFSQALPVTTYDDVPAYRYPGRVILITDSLCYSTSDFFSADFKDNRVGLIVGVDEATGGGGANVWGWSLLSGFAGVGALPAGYDFNLAMRHSLRTGAAVGLPVEDLGVKADHLHRLTRRDVLGKNSDLLDYTMSLFP
jgi:hypothetical protein